MLLALLSLAFGAAPAPLPFPIQAGQCQWVHGRFTVANGSSIKRVYVSRTSHALALYDDDERVPPAVKRYLDSVTWSDHDLWGDFYVCARERYIRGHMQHVRMQRSRGTAVVRRHRSLR